MFKVATLIGLRRWPLPGPFFWALVGAIALGVIWNETGLHFERTRRETAATWLDGTLKITHEGLRRWAESVRSDTEMIAAQPEVRELASVLQSDWVELEPGRRQWAETKFFALVAPRIERGTYLDASVVAPDGRSLVSTQGTSIGVANPVLASRSERTRAVLDGQTQFFPPSASAGSPPSQARVLAVPKWYVATPIRETDEVIAILLLRLNLADSFQRVLHAPQLGESFEILRFRRSSSSPHVDSIRSRTPAIRASPRARGASWLGQVARAVGRFGFGQSGT
ncbi:MAG: hypothetical protein QM784_26050 [Polyangiaceae bacterium]